MSTGDIMDRLLEDMILEKVAEEQLIDKILNEVTDMQFAVLLLLSYGYTPNEVAEHFEISKQRVSQILKTIRDRYKVLREE